MIVNEALIHLSNGLIKSSLTLKKGDLLINSSVDGGSIVTKSALILRNCSIKHDGEFNDLGSKPPKGLPQVVGCRLIDVQLPASYCLNCYIRNKS